MNEPYIMFSPEMLETQREITRYDMDSTPMLLWMLTFHDDEWKRLDANQRAILVDAKRLYGRLRPFKLGWIAIRKYGAEWEVANDLKLYRESVLLGREFDIGIDLKQKIEYDEREAQRDDYDD